MIRWGLVVFVVFGVSCTKASPPVVCDAGACVAPCAPTTCGAEDATCGRIADGCGGILECGSCSAGETCGGGKVANRCGPGTCAPVTCATFGYACGQSSDGCADVLACGACGQGAACTSGRCGPCVPTTCAALAKSCGVVGDGCGGVLRCGTCGAWQVCGADLVCRNDASKCPQWCPAGFSCTPDGVCTGGAYSNLVFDEKVVRVEGVLHVMGKPVELEPGAPLRSPAPLASLTFHERGAATPSASHWFLLARPLRPDVSVLIPPGEYEVRANGLSGGTTVPAGATVVDPRFVVTAERRGETFDVRSAPVAPPATFFTVSGRVLVDGAVPATQAFCSRPLHIGRRLLEVTFAEVSGRIWRSSLIDCASKDFAYSVRLPTGRYRVSIIAEPDAAQAGMAVAPGATVVDPAFEVTGMQAIDFSLATIPVRHLVAGRVTLNGATPMRDAAFCAGAGNAEREVARVRFVDQRGAAQLVSIACSSNDFSFSTRLPPATYDVMVEPGASSVEANVELAGFSVAARTAAVIQAPQSDFVVDQHLIEVAGRLTVNGAPWAGAPWCVANPSQPLFTVELEERVRGQRTSMRVRCDSTDASFAGRVPPGLYRARYLPELGASVSGSGLPVVPTTLAPWLLVNAPTSGLEFDVRGVRVAGQVRRQGVTPTVAPGCTTVAAGVEFHDRAGQERGSVLLPCTTDFTFDALVPMGTYVVRVWNTAASLLPKPYVVSRSLAIAGPLSGLVFDEVTRALDGKLTVNGNEIRLRGTRYCRDRTSPEYLTGRVDLSFVNLDQGEVITQSIYCSTDRPVTFSTTLPGGLYDVRFEGAASAAGGVSASGTVVRNFEVK